MHNKNALDIDTKAFCFAIFSEFSMLSIAALRILIIRKDIVIVFLEVYFVIPPPDLNIVLILALISQFLFATETIWLWDHNDSEVEYYRYKTSFDEKWRTVPSDHYSVKVESGDVDEYAFVFHG